MDVNPHQFVFAALASAPRRQVIAFLAQTALSTSELAQRFGISAPAVSRHLAVLQRAGLVSAERQGQRVLYRLRPEPLLEAAARPAPGGELPVRRGGQPPRAPPTQAVRRPGGRPAGPLGRRPGCRRGFCRRHPRR